ncbi:DNA repair protein RAD4-like [Vicia villosa]|uniref:DNA repair protein RAD4-like n=1 Tax=Vicia villosa TaxID=3911 RepID=UPI00273A7A78|nr:DNA repair protein RAD4-like [Vicia villosa]
MSLGHSRKSKKRIAPSDMDQSKDPSVAEDLNHTVANLPTSKAQVNDPESHITDKSHKPKRKGDLEFEMQMEMALSTTAVEYSKSKEESGENIDSSNFSCPSKRIKRVIDEESSTSPQLISTAVGSMRDVVAFAGQGAKDVTRRYCMRWHKISSQRVNSIWWDSVLAPLRNLESGATGGVVHSRTSQFTSTEANMNDSFLPTRSSLEGY